MNQPDVNHLFDGFRKKYPFIAPKAYTTRSAALLERVITEARAGKQFADVIQGNAFTLYMLAKRGHTEAYLSPEAKSYPNTYRDPAGGWIAVYLQLNVLAYNTKLVARAEAPRSYDDLLNAKWKGRMASTTSNTFGTTACSKSPAAIRARLHEKAGRAINFRSGNAACQSARRR
jgi:iron(III) transport system substrate-binding protein